MNLPTNIKPAGAVAREPFSLEKQVRFLHALAEVGNVRTVCRAMRLSPQTAYRARRSSPDFRLAWDAALLAARVHAEEVLADRALHGVEEAVFYHGEEVARRLRFDSRLLLAHLARLDRLEADGYVVEVSEDFDRALARFGRGDPVHVDPMDAHCYEEADDAAWLARLTGAGEGAGEEQIEP
jgi:hypothetical protein